MLIARLNANGTYNDSRTFVTDDIYGDTGLGSCGVYKVISGGLEFWIDVDCAGITIRHTGVEWVARGWLNEYPTCTHCER